MVATTLKVLMIGNSFSICVLHYAPDVAKRLDCNLDLASLYIGGCPLERHSANIAAGAYKDFTPYLATWNFASATNQDSVAFADALKRVQADDGSVKYFGNIPAALAAEKWDIVTIQQASHDSWRGDTFHPWADVVIDEVRKLAPQAEIVIQETWSYCNGDPRICDQAAGGAGTWGFDQAGMSDRATANYRALAAKYGFRIIPTGTAVRLFRERRQAKEVADDVVGAMRLEDGKLCGDSIHLNRDGEYLQACVWIASLFGADVTALDWAPADDMRHPGDAPLIRQCAADAAAQQKLLERDALR